MRSDWLMALKVLGYIATIWGLVRVYRDLETYERRGASNLWNSLLILVAGLVLVMA